MKIAITGASGFVGGRTERLLKDQGHETVPISRRHGVDVDDADALAAALAGCDAVIHCAGINREIGDQTYEKVHVEGTRQVVNAAQRAGVKKIILMSFLRARPDCGSPYHESKWAAEEIVRGSGMDYTVMKAGVIYGRGDHMLDHLSHAFHTFPFFALVGMKDKNIRPTAVEDMTRVLAAAVTDARLSRRTVAVTGPEEMTLSEAVKRVAATVGKRPLFFRIPVAWHYLLALIFERVMKVPLVAWAQVRILSEGLVEAAPFGDPLPED